MTTKIGFTLATLAIALTTAACKPTCVNDILALRPSPSGAHIAYLYTRACGATTGPSTHIAVLRREFRPEGIGNALVIKDPASAAESDQTTQLRWIAADSLEISLLGGRSMQSSSASVNGVAIVIVRRD